MTIKKNKIITLVFGVIFVIPFLINKIIFLCAKRYNNSIEKLNYYSWRLGNIKYNVYGNGKNIILLLHGIGVGNSSFEWSNNITELSKENTVYTLDFLGFGYSDKPDTTYTAYMYSLLINDFINDIIKHPVNVIGSSNSGAFAVMSYILKPNNFIKMILICPTGIKDNIAENNDSKTKKIIEIPIFGTSIYNIASSKSNCKKILNENIFFSKEKIDKHILNSYYGCAHFGGSSARYAFASFISNFMNVDIKNSISKIEIPLFVLWGENAVINPKSNMDIIELISPSSQYALFEKTRLLPHFENAEEFNNLAINFLNN